MTAHSEPRTLRQCILCPMTSAALWLYRGLLRGGLVAAAPALWVRDRATGKARPTLRERLGRGLPAVEPGGLWIQAVSVGEVEVARRLVTELQSRAPGLPLLVTTTTATGLGLARQTLGRSIPVHACPLDLGRSVRRVLAHSKPRALVLVETELWPEMMHQAAQLVIPTAVVNGRLSERSFARYRMVRHLLRPLLEPVAVVLARAETDAERFAGLGIAPERIRVSGNIKYDLVADETPLEWSEYLTSWADGRPVVVAGSTMDGEEAVILDAVDRLGGWRELFLILAPRHPERFDTVARLLTERGIAFARRSAPTAGPARADLLLLDTIGELARSFRFAHAAFIGGSLVPTGGHNPLEAAVWGIPVLSGPHLFNFREVFEEMTMAGGARVVADAGELAAALATWLAEPAAAAARGAAGLAVVDKNRGATERTAASLLELLERSE
jgi:3-deoxy-D-manno-octulosonic-acid transferase